MRKRTHFTIVGGGLTATAMLCQLVETLGQRAAAGNLDPRSAKLSIIEKRNHFGPGFPHNPDNLMSFHITNMCAADMGIFLKRKADFQVWINANLELLRSRFPNYPAHYFKLASPPTACRHYPRAFMGEYLRTRFQEALQAARKLKVVVNLYPHHEVVRIQPSPCAMTVTARCLSSGKPLTMESHALLLATGHWFAQHHQENYFDSPWPAAALLDSIPPEASVGVLGSSLSAIETALTLTSDGHFAADERGHLTYRLPAKPRTITLYSRQGLLPRVRGRRGTYCNRFLTREGFQRRIRQSKGGLTLAMSLELLAKELAAAYGHPVDWSEILPLNGDPVEALIRDLLEVQGGERLSQGVLWQTILAQSFPFIREWYLALRPEERRRFDRQYTSIFFCHAATQPAINARKMLALIQAGVVRVVRLGADYRFYHPKGGRQFRLKYRDSQGQSKIGRHTYIIDARGQSKTLSSDPSPLARNLVASGIALPPQSANHVARPSTLKPIAEQDIYIDPRSHQVQVSPDRWLQPPELYAVGAMTRNQIIDSSMAHSICSSTAAIARRWADIVAGQDVGWTEN